MIKLNLCIYNPWSQNWNTLWNKSSFVGKNKAVEFNGYRTNHIVNVDLHLKPRGDHAGVRIVLGLFGYDTELHFYDTRHWNYETGAWEVYDEKNLL
jgi:hypothetical protein